MQVGFVLWLRSQSLYDIILAMFVLSQVFVALAIVCILIAYQQHNKYILLTWMIGGNIFQAVALFVVGGSVGGWMAIVGAIRSVVFALLDYRKISCRSWISLSCLVIFMCASVLATVLTYKMSYEIFLLFCVLVFALGNWFRGVHYIRIATVLFAIGYIGYAIILNNWLDILLRVVYIASVVVFYVRYFQARKYTDNNTVTLPILDNNT
ncbi:MAG: YgjV family protein [Clostridiales bacterium]|nr:YgjV family protein [Clostridiales bacterium]